MIILVTGLPGHGKSLKLVECLAGDEYQDRPRFACGIDGLQLDQLNVREFDPHRWQEELPDKSLAIVDECYKWFPARSSHQRPPPYVEKLAEHRHQGIDFIFACQDPSQVDPFLRRLVDTHLHLRRNFGRGFTNIREFQGVNSWPGSDRARKEAVSIKQWKLPPKLFDLYKSATVHTVKKRLPWKLVASLLVIVGCLVAIGNLVWWGIGFGDDDQVAALEDQAPGYELMDQVSSARQYERVVPVLSDQEYANQVEAKRQAYFLSYAPLVDGLPWTAEAFREVMEPETYPKPVCALMADVGRCICHTQQSTTMHLDYQACSYYATNGFFDPTKEDPEPTIGSSRPARTVQEQTRLPAERDIGRSVNTRPPHTNWVKKQPSWKGGSG